MEAQPTTNPAPPSGIIPTEVPLGITSATTSVPGPADLVIKPLAILRSLKPIYVTQIFINQSLSVGAHVWTAESKYPLGALPNRYNTISGANDTLRPICPWSLLTAYFSRFSKIEWTYEFTPIKVADCRVSLDIISTYDEDAQVMGYSTNLMNNDSVHKNLDSQDDPLTVALPQYWASKFIETNTTIVQISTAQVNLQPANIPTTEMRAYVRGKYHPSLIQPVSFAIIVQAHANVTVAIGLSGKSLVRTVIPDISDQVSRPWFFALKQE